MLINSTQELREAIRNPYIWPGGYPTYLVMHDGESLCNACARKEYRSLSFSLRHNLSDGWRVHGADVNWEDSTLMCVHCNARIEAAYPAENLDAMSAKDLITFSQNPYEHEDARRYARLKADAMLHRLSGNISAALNLERECDTIYETLPEHLRW